jgi:hypothetical protein
VTLIEKPYISPIILTGMFFQLLLCSLSFYGLTRESTKLWCKLKRPLMSKVRWALGISALISLSFYSKIYLLESEKRNAYPVDMIIEIYEKELGVHFVDERWRELKMRSGLEAATLPPSMSYSWDDDTHELHLQGISFSPHLLPLRIREYATSKIVIDDKAPDRVVIVMEKKTKK